MSQQKPDIPCLMMNDRERELYCLCRIVVCGLRKGWRNCSFLGWAWLGIVKSQVVWLVNAMVWCVWIWVPPANGWVETVCRIALLHSLVFIVYLFLSCMSLYIPAFLLLIYLFGVHYCMCSVRLSNSPRDPHLSGSRLLKRPSDR